MLAAQFTEDTPLPLPGSIGYLRGNATKARVLRRNGDGTCLVQLFQRHPRTWAWEPTTASSGNRQVPENELYATERLAMFCGKPPKGRQETRRKGGRA